MVKSSLFFRFLRIQDRRTRPSSPPNLMTRPTTSPQNHDFLLSKRPRLPKKYTFERDVQTVKSSVLLTAPTHKSLVLHPLELRPTRDTLQVPPWRPLHSNGVPARILAEIRLLCGKRRRIHLIPALETGSSGNLLVGQGSAVCTRGSR